MLNRFRHWLSDIPVTDPLRRRQAALLQMVLLVVIGCCILGIPLSLATSGGAASVSFAIAVGAYGMLLVTTGASLALLHRGSFSPAVALSTGGLITSIGIALVLVGIDGSSMTMAALLLPVALASLLLGWRGLILTAGASVALVVGVAMLQTVAPEVVGLAGAQGDQRISLVSTFAIVLVALSLVLERFGSSLRQALAESHERQHRLEVLQANLETTIAERTASLAQALAEGERREAELQTTLEQLRTSEEVVRELSAPILPVLPNVLVAPLIGAIDSARAATLADNLLHAIERNRAKKVIFDITGVPLVDTHVAQVLLRTADSARLLGADVLLVGVRPEVAETLVTLSIDMRALRPFANLQEAVSSLQTAHHAVPGARRSGRPHDERRQPAGDGKPGLDAKDTSTDPS